jgi:ADP-ribose pyrophosphatase YjhB (NUDIX family)
LEETALHISGIALVLVQDCIHSPEFYKDAHFVLLNYTCRCAAKNPRVKLNEEGREFRWLTLADAKKLRLNRPTKILLAAVAQQRKAKSSRRRG